MVLFVSLILVPLVRWRESDLALSLPKASFHVLFDFLITLLTQRGAQIT